MDVLAITSAGYGGRVCFLDETNLCYASGHGVVIHDKETGMQKHIWSLPDGQGNPPPNMCPATFATCPGGHLLAYVQQGGQQQQIQVVQQETLLPASTIKDPGTRHMEFLQLVFDAEGTRLASLGGAPDNQLDVWDVDLKESLLRVQLPDALTGLEPVFFPLNSEVLAVGGPDAVRLLWDEPLGGARIVRQSDVDLAVLAEGEQLNCFAWTPNGTLLLGTTAGRVLGIKGAAPPAIPTGSWGENPGGGHAAELLYGPAVPTVPPIPPPPAGSPPPTSLLIGPAPVRIGVVVIVVTATHILLVMGGDATSSAELQWLSPQSMNPIATAPLPLRALVRGAVSPSYEQLAIAAADGSISTCTTVCPIPGILLGCLTGDDGSSASLAAAAAAAGTVPTSSNGGDAPPAMVAEQWSASASASGDPGRGRGSTGVGGVDGAAVAAAATAAAAAASVGTVERGALVQVTEVVRFHRGRISACLWLTPTRAVTGGMDGTLRMWSYVPNDGDPPERAGWLSPGLQLDAQWNVSQPVTCMAALNPPLPVGAEGPGAAGAGSGGATEGGGGGGHTDFATQWAASAPKPPAFMVGTAGGVVQLVNADRVPANMADVQDLAQLNASLRSTWDVQVFGAPITAAAFSQDGRFCAVSCASESKVAFLRVMVLGHELSMRVLGFYPMREPRHLAWAPPEPGGIHPLLVVSTILGEIVVLGLPDSSALEDGPPDGLLPRGSLLKASMRAQSHVTSLVVYPLPASEARGGGHFWVITTHTDKSIRRYRMFTDQQKAAAAVSARAAALAAAAASSGDGGGGGSGGGGGGGGSSVGGTTFRQINPSGGNARGNSAVGANLGRAVSMAPGSQNFQMPEAEKPMELQLAANELSISMLPGGNAGGGGGGGGGGYGSPLRMAVASSDGSVAVYSMPEIALQGRWLLHEMVCGGATGVCLLGDRLLAAGGEGTIQILEIISVAARARNRASHVGAPPGAGGSALVAPSPTGGTAPSPTGGTAAGRVPGQVLSTLAQRSAFFQPAGPPRPRGMERATLGSILPVHLQTVLPVMYTDADAAPTWQEARAQATRELYREQLTSFRKKAHAKCREWVERVKELHKINEAADEVERLTPEEFMIDVGLRNTLLGEAETRYARVKAQLVREMRVKEFQRQRLKEECMSVMECVSRPLVALGEYTFISPMDPAEARRYRFEGEASAARTDGGVWSYGLCKMKAAQELRLKQVSFLRKVEQAEHALRNSMERGAVVPIRRYKGDMQRKFTLLSEEEQQATAAQQQQGQQGQPLGQPLQSGQLPVATGQGPGGLGHPQRVQPTYDDDVEEDETQSVGGSSMKRTRPIRDDGFEGTESGYGETGLMYADVQLYTHCRRVSQLVFIREEIRCLRRLFNSKWEASRAAKQKSLDRIDERLGRIVEIQKELTKLALEEGAGEPPPPAPQHVPGEFYMWTPEEEMVALTAVRDEEVHAAKYISPEERARRAAEAAAEEEARRRAEADDARNRALKEMMNNNPAISRKSKGGKNRQVREAWMDLAPGQMTKEQRLKLAEWERKQQELAEELDKHRRLLEAERRALEVDIAEIAAGINTDLTRLSNAKIRMDMEIVYLERRAADLADLMASLSAARAARSALTVQLAANTTRRTRRSPLLAALEAKVQAAQRAYEDVALSEKQVDKAFRREFSSRPELWDDAQKVYRARAHLLQASPSTGSLGPAAGAAGGGGGGGGPVTTARLPRKSALELLGKSPEGQALAAVLEVPGPGDVSLSQSTTSVAPVSRQTTLSRALTGRLTTLDSLGGSSAAGAPNPDVLLTTPRRPLRDMAHVARPLPRPGSALQAFLQKHLEPQPKGSDGAAASGGGSTGNAPPTQPLAPATPRHGIGAVLIMAGEEAALARRGVSQRPAGLRLRALVEKEGRPLDRLLQMVADGLPPSALTVELGPLGLRLGSNMPGNLNPYKLEGPASIFNPEVTGAAAALSDVGGGNSSAGGSQAGGGNSSPVRERSSASGGRSTNNGSISPLKPDEGAEAEEEEEDPLDSKERPEGMDDSLWIRLLEFRQTRADLEMEAEEAWRRVLLLTAQLDWIEAEDASMEAAVEEAGARAAALRDGSTRLSLDVSLTYRLRNGQVELPERPSDVVGAGDVLADALILHRNRVESLNEEVLSRGESKIEVLEELRLMRRKIHLTQWETEAAELAGQHAAQRLTELQLLHVTKDLQAALRDPTIVDRLHEEDRLLSVRQNIANLHAHKLEQRRRQLGSLRARVTRSGTEQGELSVAEAAAEAAFQESTRMHLMMSHAKASEDASHRRHMRAIVTNAQLRAIAQQQAADLEQFSEQLRTAHARNFPALKPMLAWAPPDYRPASAAAAAAAAAAAIQPPGSRAASRGGDPSMAMATIASRPGSAAMPLPGVQRRASSGLQTRSSSGGGPGSRPGSRAGTPPVPPRSGPLSGLTRSGGAGATLTRAYVLATGGGAMGAASATAMGSGGVNGSSASRPQSSASRRL